MADKILLEQHYHTLNLRAGVSLDAVKRSYHRLALKFHPDRGGSLEKMQQINAAYDAVVAAIMNGTAPKLKPVRRTEHRQWKPRKDGPEFVPGRSRRVEITDPDSRFVIRAVVTSPERQSLREVHAFR